MWSVKDGPPPYRGGRTRKRARTPPSVLASYLAVAAVAFTGLALSTGLIAPPGWLDSEPLSPLGEGGASAFHPLPLYLASRAEDPPPPPPPKKEDKDDDEDDDKKKARDKEDDEDEDDKKGGSKKKSEEENKDEEEGKDEEEDEEEDD